MKPQPHDHGDQGRWPKNRGWVPRVVDPRSPAFGLRLAAACAVGAVWAFVAWRPVAGFLLGFCAASFAVSMMMRPPQRLRSGAREGNAIVVGLPVRHWIAGAAFVSLPAFAAVVAAWMSGVIGWAGSVTITSCVFLLLLAIVVAAREHFRVSDDALEHVSCWGHRWSTRLPWPAILRVEYTRRETEAGVIPGFHVEGRTPKRFCTVIFVPEHLDGIGDFAEATLRRVAADVLAKDPAGCMHLRELAGRTADSNPQL